MVPLVKICGLSTVETLAAALEVRADRIGLVFYPKSPRHVTLDQAVPLAAMARGRAAIVALTVDADDDLLEAIVAAIDPDMLQFHGRESPDRVAAIRARFGRPVIKAIGISSTQDLAAALDYAGVADELLFDAKPPAGAKLPGGNGVAFDWRILAALDLDIPFMLSGGLAPGTVGEAVRITRAPAVDVSSGVESAPGIKQPELIAVFVAAARAAGYPSVAPPRSDTQKEFQP